MTHTDQAQEATIAFGGQLSREQFGRMQRLAMSSIARKILWFITIFLMICMLINLTAKGFRSGSVDLTSQVLQALPLLIFIIALIATPRNAIRKQWVGNAAVKGCIEGVADHNGIVWNGPFVTGRYPWDALVKRKAAKDIILLYTAPNSVLYFPRSFFVDETSWYAFEELTSRMVPRIR